MLKYRFNVSDALERIGFNTYKARNSGIISQGAMKKIKEESTNINLDTLNKLCVILDMQPKDILYYVETDEDKAIKEKLNDK